MSWSATKTTRYDGVAYKHWNPEPGTPRHERHPEHVLRKSTQTEWSAALGDGLHFLGPCLGRRSRVRERSRKCPESLRSHSTHQSLSVIVMTTAPVGVVALPTVRALCTHDCWQRVWGAHGRRQSGEAAGRLGHMLRNLASSLDTNRTKLNEAGQRISNRNDMTTC